MTMALLLLAAQAAAPAATPPPPVTLTVPSDWEPLAPLPWRDAPRITPELAAAAGAEAKAGQCVLPQPEVEVDMAVQLRPDGSIARIVPRAINCVTVEQFAAGLVSSFARAGLRPAAEGWYRTRLTFTLPK